MHDAWLSWLYFYGVGGCLLAGSLVYSFRSGAVRWSLWTDRRLVLVLVCGTLLSAVVHAAWIRLAIG